MGDEALELTVVGSCGYPISGHTQDQDGWGFGQPDLVESFSAYGRELHLDSGKSPFQSRSFCDLMTWGQCGGLSLS